MRGLVAITVLGMSAVLPSPAPAAPLDGSVPMVCALVSVVECSRRGDCARSDPATADVPAFVRVDVTARRLSSMDGSRTSPIAAVMREGGRLVLQGMQNARAWGVAIDAGTGEMSATIAESDGAFVIGGACTVP